MKDLVKKFAPGLLLALTFWLGFALGTRHGRAEAISLGDLKKYYELGKDLGETIKRIDARLVEMQKDSDHLKQIRATLSGEKASAPAPAK